MGISIGISQPAISISPAPRPDDAHRLGRRWPQQPLRGRHAAADRSEKGSGRLEGPGWALVGGDWNPGINDG